MATLITTDELAVEVERAVEASDTNPVQLAASGALLTSRRFQDLYELTLLQKAELDAVLDHIVNRAQPELEAQSASLQGIATILGSHTTILQAHTGLFQSILAELQAHTTLLEQLVASQA